MSSKSLTGLLFCSRCVMNGTAKEIVLENGICNFCRRAEQSLEEIEEEKKNLNDVIERIKKDGAMDYDVLIGLSGGTDSSTALHYVVRLGLRPFCFSIDNGWNDPRADENIMRMVETLKVPFYRYTIDLKKFRKLQGAFMQAGLKNVEIPTDHILMAASFELAQKYGIRWIISGGNVATESIMPESWSYTARDLKHIKGVYKKMTGERLRGLPMCSLWQFNLYKWWYGIKTLYLLDYLDYNRSESIKMLEREYGYQSYGEKHEESVFTKWFQSFYLFEKFGIDKRIAHFSSLIMSDQMTREEAVERLKESPVYPKLGIEEKIMQYPNREHREFPTDEKLWKFITIFIRALRKPYRKLTRTG